MGLLQVFGRQVGAAWARLSPGHRLILVLLGLICIGGLVGAVFWAAAPDYEILCTDVTPKECASLVAELKGQGITARLTQGGTAVLVPAGKIDEARMVAAEEGIPGTVQMGFESFREPKIGMTPFAERINYVSALQNELAATIMSLDSVHYARVHLVISERELFVRDRKKATASVLVMTQGGQALTRRHAVAIANLVASAVDGLAATDVTITDAQGNVLVGGGQAGAELAADDQLSYRQKMEQYLAQKAESMLATVLGFNRCEIRVSAELTFKDSRETMKEYDPDKKVVVSERIESSQTTGSGAEVGGLVGSVSNVPGEQQAASGGASGLASSSKTDNIDTEYLVSESLRETVNRGVEIKRLTVAAFVDMSSLQAPTEDETGQEAEGQESQLAVLTLEDVTDVIREAVGLDESRGDTLKIVQASFYPLVAAPAGVRGRIPRWAVQVGEYFAVGVVGLVLLIVARRALKGIEVAGPRRVLVPEVLDAEGMAPYPTQTDQDELIRQEISRLIDENPEMASRMIEGWVEGEE